MPQLPKWLALVAAFIVNGYVWGNLYSYSIFYAYLRERSPEHEMHISLIGSFLFGVTLFGSLFMAPLMDRISIRLLYAGVIILYALGPLCSAFVTDVRLWYFTYTIPVGFGGAGICILSYVTAAHAYPSRVCAASTFVSAGTSVFSIIIPSIYEFILKSYDLRITLFFISSCFFATLLFTPMFPSELIGVSEEEDDKCKPSPHQIPTFHSTVSMQIGSMISLAGRISTSRISGSFMNSKHTINAGSVPSIYVKRRKKFSEIGSFSNIDYQGKTLTSLLHLNKNNDQDFDRIPIDDEKTVSLPNIKNIVDSEPEFSLWTTLTSKSMLVWLFANILHFSFNNIAYVHLTNYALYLTPHPLAAPSYFMIGLGCGATVSKILYAFLIENFNFPVLLSVQITLMTFGIALSLLGLLQYVTSDVTVILVGLYVSTFLLGFGEGGIWSLAYPATYEACYPHANTVIYCIYCALISLPYCLGGPIGSFIYEQTKDYAFAFNIASLAYMIAANCLWFMPKNLENGRAQRKLASGKFRSTEATLTTSSQVEMEISTGDESC